MSLKNDIAVWQSAIDMISDTREQTKRFVDCVRTHINACELTVPIVKELIEKT